MTLDEARKEFFRKANLKEGGRCPCCDRYGKVYTRRINANMAFALINLYKLTIKHKDRTWFLFSEFTETRNDYEKLLFWNLIAHKPNDDDPSKRDSGYWRLTDEGRRFVELRVMIPAKVIVYDARVKGYSADKVSITAVLGKAFSYSELMMTGVTEPLPPLPPVTAPSTEEQNKFW